MRFINWLKNKHGKNVKIRVVFPDFRTLLCLRRNIWAEGGMDSWLLAAVAVLLVFGLAFIYSSTREIGLRPYGDALFYFKRQLLWAGGGVVLAAFAARYFSSLFSGSRPLYFLAGVWALLIMPLFFEPVAHVHRWIRLGGLVLQPSAFAGPALILFLALNLAGKKDRSGFSAFTFPLAATAATLLLTGLGWDLGAIFVLSCTALFMLVAGGMRKRHLAVMLSAVGLWMFFELIRHPYRLSRIMAWFNSSAPLSAGYQTVMSRKFIFSGGLFGNFPSEKMTGLPAFHTDFAFAALAASLGWVAALITAGAMVFLVFRAARIARNAAPRAEKLLAGGIAFYIGLKALLHLLKCLGFIPPNGISFPLISYGGSDLVAVILMIGVLLYIPHSGCEEKGVGRIG